MSYLSVVIITFFSCTITREKQSDLWGPLSLSLKIFLFGIGTIAGFQIEEGGREFFKLFYKLEV